MIKRHLLSLILILSRKEVLAQDVVSKGVWVYVTAKASDCFSGRARQLQSLTRRVTESSDYTSSHNVLFSIPYRGINLTQLVNDCFVRLLHITVSVGVFLCA